LSDTRLSKNAVMSLQGGGFVEQSDRTDLFISYAGPDRAWAEWAAAQLEASGYTVELDVWDWAAGDNFVVRMSDALVRAERVLSLWSPAYFERHRFTTPEWTAVIADQARQGTDPGGPAVSHLVPVRVAPCDPPPVLASMVYRDLFGLDEQQARVELLSAMGGSSGREANTPFPGAGAGAGQGGLSGPRVPGTIPAVWNLPARNLMFTGRESLLAALRSQLAGGHRSAVQVLHGMGGVGKTQLAVEYAHLFCGDYDLAWWIDAERPELISEQITRLGQAAGWVQAGAVADAAWRVVSDRLRQAGTWLIVFDNATELEHIRGWLPQGPGHVVITSRHRGFSRIAALVQVEVFSRSESAEFLHNCLPELPEPDAGALAEALGDLPLALAQSGGLIAETAMPVPEYIDELTEHAGELLAEARPLDYPATLAAALDISMDRLSHEDQAAVELLHLASVLASDPIPLNWFGTASPGVLPDRLAQVACRPLHLRRTLGRLSDLGLAQLSSETIHLHRLTQAVLRDRQTADELVAIRERATRLLVSAAPDNDGVDPASWPDWAAVLPHLLALDPATAPAEIRHTACDAIWYLLMRGEYRTALPLAEDWYAAWMRTSGRDDHRVLWAANHLAELKRFLGMHQEAHDLNRDTAERRRRTQGPDHFDTLIAASNLAINLGDLGHHQKALELNQDIFARRVRTLGPDHYNTLSSANNIARNLTHLNRHQEARDLDEDTLARRRRALGTDHPRTLTSASNLAADLRELGRYQEARELDQDTLDRRRRTLGPDNPDALDSASNLAADLHALGDFQGARELNQDTLDRRRRTLGPDHPDTRKSESNLGTELRHVGGRSSTAST
jgi:TIR domain/Tetratricopeptide repeat